MSAITNEHLESTRPIRIVSFLRSRGGTQSFAAVLGSLEVSIVFFCCCFPTVSFAFVPFDLINWLIDLTSSFPFESSATMFTFIGVHCGDGDKKAVVRQRIGLE